MEENIRGSATSVSDISTANTQNPKPATASRKSKTKNHPNLKSHSDKLNPITIPLRWKRNAHVHLGMFPISSVQVILHKLPRQTILRLGDILF